jgi:hypothetical protein
VIGFIDGGKREYTEKTTDLSQGTDKPYYLISPAISNGLSFNKKTGTISGVPIVASDSVTYTVTAVGRHGRDTLYEI